jgi:hypothetical protein
MNTYNFVITVFNDADFKPGSTDNINTYSRHFFGISCESYPVSMHGIKVYRDDDVVNSCILVASGGATSVTPLSSCLEDNQLLVCCCDTVFCLMPDTLNLLWQVQGDPVTCFAIYKVQQDYLIHGELEVTRIDKFGSIKWRFSGSDIFVTTNETDEVQLFDNYILLTDFNMSQYKIDFDGNVLSTT